MTGTGWFYALAGKRHGPVGVDELVAALCAAEDPRAVVVWNQELSRWTTAGEVADLQKRLPPPLPPGFGDGPDRAETPPPSAEGSRSAQAIGPAPARQSQATSTPETHETARPPRGGATHKAASMSSFARDFPRLALAWAAVTLVVLPKDGALALLAGAGNAAPGDGFATIVSVSTAASLNALLFGAATAGLLAPWRTERRRIPWYGNLLAMLVTALLAMAAYSVLSGIEKAVLTTLWTGALLVAGCAAVLALLRARDLGVVWNWVVLAAVASPMLWTLLSPATRHSGPAPTREAETSPASQEGPKAFVGRHPKWLSVFFDGEIVRGDSARLAVVLDENKDLLYSELLYINSDGGDMREAMAMGRLVRSRKLSVAIDTGQRCLSSCVLVLAGRWEAPSIAGLVGVHRPFSADARGEDGASLSRRVQEMKAEITAYLQEMNVSPLLADLMMATPPDRVRPLTKAELDRYLLSQADPAAEEEKTAEWAREWGITSSEYRRRSRIVNAECGRPVLEAAAESLLRRAFDYPCPRPSATQQDRCTFAAMRGETRAEFMLTEVELTRQCGTPDSCSDTWRKCAAAFFGVPEGSLLVTGW